MSYTEDLTKLKLRKSQFNLSISLTAGELSAIFDTTKVQTQSNCKNLTFYPPLLLFLNLINFN